MITLHKFNAAWGLPDISLFCIKAETYLRMAGIEYRTIVTDSRKAPKGKCPYIVHDGVTISDSSSIVAYLEGRAAQPIDASLTPEQKAVTAAFKALFEEQYYFIICWFRWVDPAGWKIYRKVLIELATGLGVPRPIAWLLVPWFRRNMRRTLWLQGTGRHTPEEMVSMGKNLLTAVSDWLKDQQFMLGDEPHVIDATAYGFLAGLIWAPFEGPLKAHAIQLGNLVPYCERMKVRFWS